MDPGCFNVYFVFVLTKRDGYLREANCLILSSIEYVA